MSSPPRPKVLLTNPIHPDAHDRLARHADVVVAPATDDDTLRRAVADIDGLIVRTRLPDDVFAHQTRLRGVVRHGVGLDMIPVEQATQAGIPVANVPGSNTESVVEYCLQAMFRHSRSLEALRLPADAGQWDAVRARALATEELDCATLGIVGVGTIGGHLARAALALGMKVLGLGHPGVRAPSGVELVDKQILFASADVVALTCPLTDETRGLVDALALSWMRPTALLINVARGPVVVREALMDSLRNGAIGAAVLDVHEVQPIPAGTYPVDLPNLTLTPHVAGITRTSMRRMSEGSVDEMIRMLQGKQFRNLVNPEVYPKGIQA